MDVAANVPARRYSAFISYSRHDSRDAEWLQRALERFRMPSRLVSDHGGHAGVAERLRPLFLDRLELAAASDLKSELEHALADSDWLIIICTPWSAMSEWVNAEVRLMQQMGRGDCILPALFDGDQNNAFPPALRSGDDGPLTPLAADFRRAGDGRRLALMKLVAAMTGVGLGDLVHRESHRRHRQMTGVALLSAGGMAAFAALSIVALRAQQAAEFERARSEAMVETLITDLRAAVKPLGSLKALGVINEAAARYFRGQPIDQMKDEALAQRARLLIAMGEDEVTRGSMATARVHFEEAHRLTATRLAAAPDDVGRLADHAASEFWLGREAWSEGDSKRAREAWSRYRSLTLALLAKEPDNPDRQLEAGYAETNLGMLDLRADLDLLKAERRFESALAYYRQVKLLRPDDYLVTMDLSDGLAWLADTYRLSGRIAAARALRVEQRGLLERRLAENPGSYPLAQDLLFNRIALARIADGEGANVEAEDLFRLAAAEAEQLLVKDPLNAMVAGARRIAQLFAIRSQLRLADKLQAERIRVGDCAMSGQAANPAEVADWCQMIVARQAFLMGDTAKAEAALAAVTARQLRPGAPRLSDWFGLDFAKEVAEVRTMEGKG